MKKIGWIAGIAVLLAGAAQADLVYSQDFNSLAFAAESRDPLALGGATPDVVATEWLAGHSSVALANTQLEFTQITARQRFRGAAVWLDTAGWTVGTVTVAFNVSDWVSPVAGGGDAYLQAISATGVDASNSVTVDLGAGPLGAVFAATGTAAIDSSAARNYITGNGSESFTFNYAGTEQYVGLVFGIRSDTASTDTTPGFSMDNLTVNTIPEPAVLSFVVIFGGGILVLKRRFS